MKICYFCLSERILAQMRKIITYISAFCALAFSAAGQGVQTEIQEKVAAIAADATFAHAAVGICARTLGGAVIADINSEKMLVPASNMKLISTGAALHALGPDYRYRTRLAYDGEVSGGVLHGNLHILGGGDPTTGSKDSIAVNLEQTFRQWTAAVRNAGIDRIEGYIIGDGRCFEGMPEEPTWLWNDIGVYYGAGVTGLMFHENIQSFSVSAGSAVGDMVNISPSYPETPWMTFRYSCSTGKAGTGDKLYMYTTELAPVAEIRGTFGVDRAAKRVDCANKFPEYTFAHYFLEYLEDKGIECAKGAADYRLKTDWQDGSMPGELKLLGEVESPALERIVFETNHASNNLFAETLLRTLGKELKGNACYDSSYVAMDDVMKSLGLSPGKGLRLQDGSGLSRQNLVSPDFICRFLGRMAESDCFGTYLKSLPSPGGNGTMQYNMKGYPPALRDRIKVKSGSMNGIRCYSGYILPAGYASMTDEEAGRRIVVFSIMTNNCTSPTWKVRPLLDKIMAALAEGC